MRYRDVPDQRWGFDEDLDSTPSYYESPEGFALRRQVRGRV